MKPNTKDNGLRKALTAKHSALPSNFTFSTMQKIDDYMFHKEKKREQRLFYAAVAVSVLLMAYTGFITYHYYSEELPIIFIQLSETFSQLKISKSPYGYLGIIVLILLLIDYMMRSSYSKRHKDQEDCR